MLAGCSLPAIGLPNTYKDTFFGKKTFQKRIKYYYVMKLILAISPKTLNTFQRKQKVFICQMNLNTHF